MNLVAHNGTARVLWSDTKISTKTYHEAVARWLDNEETCLNTAFTGVIPRVGSKNSSA
jgi:hypothetical protein